MKCIKCGSKLNSKDMYCSNCGTKISNNTKLKIIMSIILVVTLIPLVLLILFKTFLEYIHPEDYFFSHKKELNRIIKNIDKGQTEPKEHLIDITGVYYEGSYVYMRIRNPLNPFVGTYRGLIYSYDGKPHSPEVGDDYLYKLGDDTWGFGDDSGYSNEDYVRVRKIDTNWFSFEEQF